MDIASLSARLTHEEPARMVARETAGVAVILRNADEVLLITRAERQGDPWSGQVALPGGMVEPGDKRFVETARREALEEVGVNLAGGAEFLGYIGRFRSGGRDVLVVPSVFKLKGPAEVSPNAEVASYAWVPLSGLARGTYGDKSGGNEVPRPALVYREMTVWGLTERILSEIIG